MATLVTFPGRYGDLLWALPTVRAISEILGEPVDLQICGEFAPIVPLLQQQPYLRVIIEDDRWNMAMGWQAPPLAQPLHDRVIHLGYRRWPALPLPMETYVHGAEALPALSSVNLTRPWITIDGPGAPVDIACGWSDCYFELKVGLMTLLDREWEHGGPTYGCFPPKGSRWWEARTGLCIDRAGSWVAAAKAIRNSDLFLGDCSALHVLAVALGKPVVCYEPMEARHNPIFYPLGQDGPQVTLVRGLDGQPTTDSRHTAETIEQVLKGLHG